MEEYRTRLSRRRGDFGKLDVREAAAQLPDEDEVPGATIARPSWSLAEKWRGHEKQASCDNPEGIQDHPRAGLALRAWTDMTVLIGPNGAGKSNFISFFRMMSWMLALTPIIFEFTWRSKAGPASSCTTGRPLPANLIEAELTIEDRRWREPIIPSDCSSQPETS